eukprot:COSAG06_NODE_4239_length_4440_cov_13.692237_1_plen_387_part_10
MARGGTQPPSTPKKKACRPRKVKPTSPPRSPWAQRPQDTVLLLLLLLPSVAPLEVLWNAPYPAACRGADPSAFARDASRLDLAVNNFGGAAAANGAAIYTIGQGEGLYPRYGLDGVPINGGLPQVDGVYSLARNATGQPPSYSLDTTHQLYFFGGHWKMAHEGVGPVYYTTSDTHGGAERVPITWAGAPPFPTVTCIDAQRRTKLDAGILRTLKTDDDQTFEADPVSPSVLFCGAQAIPLKSGVDIDFMAELFHNHSIEVDWVTHSSACLDHAHAYKYNVLVMFRNPACDLHPVDSGCLEKTDADLATDEQFTAAVLEFISYGGGVFLIPYEQSSRRQMLYGLTEALGVKLPVESIVENDPDKTSVLHHAPTVPISLGDVYPSPVTP